MTDYKQTLALIKKSSLFDGDEKDFLMTNFEGLPRKIKDNVSSLLGEEGRVRMRHDDRLECLKRDFLLMRRDFKGKNFSKILKREEGRMLKRDHDEADRIIENI